MLNKVLLYCLELDAWVSLAAFEKGKEKLSSIFMAHCWIHILNESYLLFAEFCYSTFILIFPQFVCVCQTVHILSLPHLCSLLSVLPQCTRQTESWENMDYLCLWWNQWPPHLCMCGCMWSCISLPLLAGIHVRHSGAAEWGYCRGRQTSLRDDGKAQLIFVSCCFYWSTPEMVKEECIKICIP